jgi:hypothetical protein
VRPLAVLVVLALTVAVAAGVRSRMGSGILGYRYAYGRPLSDWAGLTAFGLGAGLAALVAGLPWLSRFFLIASLVESIIVLRAVRPPRRPR